MVVDARDEGGIAPALDDRHSWGWTPSLVVALVSLVLVLEALTMSYLMVSMSIPLVAAHYGTAQGAWLLTTFLLVGGVTAPVIGKLADMYGKRRLLLVCASAGSLGAVISAVAGSYGIMLLGRGVSGLLVSVLFLSYSLIRDVFPRNKVSMAVSIATSGMGLVSIPAPFLSGWLLDTYGFRSLFWFLAVLLAALVCLIAVSIDESPVRLRTRLDLVGAALLGGGIAGVLVAVSVGPGRGWTSALTVASATAGTVLLGAWVVSARRVPAPLVDLGVLGKRSVFSTVLGAGLAYGSAGVVAILLPLLATTPTNMGLGYGFGSTAQQLALLQAPMGIMVVVGGVAVGLLVGRGSRPRTMLAVGMATMTAGYLLLAWSHSSEGFVILACGILGVGMGFAYAAIPNLLIEAVAPELQASTASIVGVSQNVFPAILPVVIFSVLNGNFVASRTPDGVFYVDAGFRVGFLIGAAATMTCVFVALSIPRSIVQTSVR